jgi:hypothetical protein
MLWAQSAEGREAMGTLEASTAVHDLFLAVCCVFGQQQYLQHVLTVWGQQQQQQQELWQRNQGLRHVLECVGAAPAELRLHVAVDMAAAAVVQAADDDTSAAPDDPGLQQVGPIVNCSQLAARDGTASAAPRRSTAWHLLCWCLAHNRCCKIKSIKYLWRGMVCRLCPE